jgi:hypothetical protein
VIKWFKGGARLEALVKQPQAFLVATARRRDDGVVIYSQMGTENQYREFRPDQFHKLREHLCGNCATAENADKFLDSLLKTGFAEIRQPVLRTKFSTGSVPPSAF